MRDSDLSAFIRADKLLKGLSCDRRLYLLLICAALLAGGVEAEAGGNVQSGGGD